MLALGRQEHRHIIALDLDNFYVGVERLRNPSLVGVPVGIKQKGILATCSYEARAQGVGKLMGLREAKEKCPEMRIVDGSDLTNYRAYSTRVFQLVRAVLGPSAKVEKLGMDELFIDVTALVRAQVAAPADGPKDDNRTWMALQSDEGLWYTADAYAGHVLPDTSSPPSPSSSSPSGLELETHVTSHIAAHLRSLILDRIGLTSSAGVAPSKLLSKLLASVHKPADQTTLSAQATKEDVQDILDPMPIRKIPGFGSSTVDTLVLKLSVDEHGNPPPAPSVALVRSTLALSDFQKLYTPRLAPILHGLLHGHDPAPVVPSPEYPAQISTEDSFAGTVNQRGGMRWIEFLAHARRLLENLVRRLEDELLLTRAPSPIRVGPKGKARETARWARYPQTLRLSLRRSWDSPAFARTSKSASLPAGVFETDRPVEERVAELLEGKVKGRDGLGGVAGGLVKALLDKQVGNDGLEIYVINWAAVNLSPHPPAAPDQTLSSFLSNCGPPRPQKRKMVPPELDLAMLASLPADVRAEVLEEYGLSEADVNGAMEGDKRQPGAKRRKESTSSALEVIDLLSDSDQEGALPSEPKEEAELPPEDGAGDAFGTAWVADDGAESVVGTDDETAMEADDENGNGAEGEMVRCPEPGCDALLFPFALQAHARYHET